MGKTNNSELISADTSIQDMSYVQLIKEGSRAGSSDQGTKLIGISSGAVSAVTGSLAIIGEEFGEDLLSGLGSGALIGIGFMIYRFFKVAREIEDEFEHE